MARTIRKYGDKSYKEGRTEKRKLQLQQYIPKRKGKKHFSPPTNTDED